MAKPKGLMLAIGLPKGGGPEDEPGEDGGAPESGQQPHEDCVPLDVLSMPDSDNGDQMAPPGVGDAVQYTVEGKVTAIKGGNACIERTAINGQPIDQAAEASPEDQAEAGDAEGDGLRGEAAQMSGLGGPPGQ
jgi:hypothetical protein